MKHGSDPEWWKDQTLAKAFGIGYVFADGLVRTVEKGFGFFFCWGKLNCLSEALTLSCCISFATHTD